MVNLTFEFRNAPQYTKALALIIGIAFICELLKLSRLSILTSLIGHGYMLHTSYNKFLAIQADFSNIMLSTVVLTFVGELSALFNPQYLRTSYMFWIMVLCHLIRNFVMTWKFIQNIHTSQIYNYFWERLYPFPIAGVLFLLLEIFIFGQESGNFIFFFVYNISVCLPILFAALRQNHTSYGSYILMLPGTAAFMISEIFYFTNVNRTVQTVETADQSVSETALLFGLRVTFLLIGSALILAATHDHVTEYENRYGDKIYFGMDDNGILKPRGRSMFLSPTKLPPAAAEPII